jgi:hypothetical protein
LTVTDGEIDFYETREYDNQNRLTRSERWNTYKPTGSSSSSSSSSASGGLGNLISREDAKYDLSGRVYRSTKYGVDPITGIVGNGLNTDRWFDGREELWKQQNPGASTYERSFYDGVRRLMKSYTAYYDSDPLQPGEKIFVQAEFGYDNATNLIQQIVRKRFHDATGVGPLTTPGGSQPKARVSYSAVWPDPLGREKARADYGTNHADAWTRPNTVTARSDTVLVTSTNYNIRGEIDLITDPAAIVRRQVFDDAGRLAKVVEDYSLSAGHLNQESTFIYNVDNKVISSTRKNSSTGDQTTLYTYGTALTDSDIASNLLLKTVTLPDSAGGTDVISFKFNRLGELKEKQDQNQTIHVYEYDKLGRKTHDRVTSLGSGLDGTVRRLTFTYEVRGMIIGVRSYDNATVGLGSVVNDVVFEYNSFAQISKDYQSHSGAVNTASSPKVQYTYANGSANHVRLLTMIYPNGRVLTYDYASGADDVLSRVTALKISATALVTYTYVGVEDRVRVQYNEPGVELTYIYRPSSSSSSSSASSGSPYGDGGDQYTGWDRFGRVVDLRWLKTANGVDLERIQYGFDRLNNRIFRDNIVAASNQDEYYSYNQLSELLAMDRGNLNATRTGISGTPVREEDFTYDPLGNWNQYVVKVPQDFGPHVDTREWATV